jgi:hypothetical protein
MQRKMTIEDVKNWFISELNIEKDDTVVVTFSGNPDTEEDMQVIVAKISDVRCYRNEPLEK